VRAIGGADAPIDDAGGSKAELLLTIYVLAALPAENRGGGEIAADVRIRIADAGVVRGALTLALLPLTDPGTALLRPFAGRTHVKTAEGIRLGPLVPLALILVLLPTVGVGDAKPAASKRERTAEEQAPRLRKGPGQAVKMRTVHQMPPFDGPSGVVVWSVHGGRYGPGISTPQGGMQTMPVSGQSVAQRIPVVGRHADPGGNPCATQSASFWHSVQSLCPNWAQKLLFAVVLMQ
jgi:hypothetical protein